MDRLKECARFDPVTGNVKFEGMYVTVQLTFAYDSSVFSIPYSHVVWFLTYGRWPKPDYFLDHVNNNAMDNAPLNLQEMTRKNHHLKHKGTRIYRNYGKSKFGYGIYVSHVKKIDRYYVGRCSPRSLGGINKAYGGYSTLEEAEETAAWLASEMKDRDLTYFPPKRKRPPRRTKVTEHVEKIVEMRQKGYTVQQIVKSTNLSTSAIYKKTRHFSINDRRRVGEQRGNSKLTDDKVRVIRQMFAEKVKVRDIAKKMKISIGQAYNIINKVSWGHVK
jgi:HNH endonuclease/helix-turn-helix resolvase-like protein